MQFQEEQRQELNNKLNECIENMSEANRYKKLITRTEEDCNRLEQKWQKLKAELKKEEHDVEKLSKISFANFLHTILNDKEEQLDKEKQEAFTAKLKCDSVLSQLEECKSTLNKLTEKHNRLRHAKEEYATLLKKKRDFILSNMPDKWSGIERGMEEDRMLSSQLKEIREAINAGNNTMTCINHALDALQSAANWGTMDMLGGGVISTMVKRDKMNEAQSYMTDMQKWIGIFARELKDIDTTIEADLQLDSFLGFADYFFDGFFVDWAVQSKINSAKDKVHNICDEVQQILSKLSIEAKTLENKKREINNAITIIIERA